MMNLAELIVAAIAAEPKLAKAQARAISAGIVTSLTAAAVRGEYVSIPGFGEFRATRLVVLAASFVRRARLEGRVRECRLLADQAAEGGRQRLSWRTLRDPRS